MATKLMTSGALKPCQTMSLYSGSVPPTTGRAAAASDDPIDLAGITPTMRQLSASTSIGVRIQRGGSSGWRGGSLGGGPKKIS